MIISYITLVYCQNQEPDTVTILFTQLGSLLRLAQLSSPHPTHKYNALELLDHFISPVLQMLKIFTFATKSPILYYKNF